MSWRKDHNPGKSTIININTKKHKILGKIQLSCLPSVFLSIYAYFCGCTLTIIIVTYIKLCIGVSVAHENQEHVLKLLRQQPIYLIKLTSQDQKDDKVCIVGFYVMHCSPDPNVEGLITSVALVLCSQKLTQNICGSSSGYLLHITFQY